MCKLSEELKVELLFEMDFYGIISKIFTLLSYNAFRTHLVFLSLVWVYVEALLLKSLQIVPMS